MTEQYDMNKKYYENHPAADIFPMMDRTTFFDLVEDIRVNGQIEPIVLCNDLVLDGRNRYAACVHLGIEPKFREYDGDPNKVVDYVVSLNLKRRHLDTSQRGMVAAKIATYEHGGDRVSQESKAQNCALKQQQAADVMNVSRRTVQDARKVINEGTPELVAACEAGEIPVSTAASIVSKPAEEQKAVVNLVKSGMEPKNAMREIKRQEHAAKVEQARANPTPPNQDGPFDIILADPPWPLEYDVDSRSPENHYNTTSIDELKLHSPNTKKDSILFMWATAPKLIEAIELMESWGFTYRTHAIWNKGKIGCGWWFRNQHELLMVGIKGSPGTPPEGLRKPSIMLEQRTEHSVKPMCVPMWIEEAFPTHSKLEMYCRSPRPNWAAWGNEISLVDANG